MERCETCKHWERYDAEWREWTVRDGHCELAHAVGQFEPDYPDAKALPRAEDECVEMWLDTSADFGCVAWEAKET